VNEGNPDMANLLNSLGLDQLPRADRLELVKELWDSIAAEGPPPLTDAQSNELRRRAAEDDASPDDVIPWEQVKARTAARLRS
jgi:putative addiction module component (TIGR02574 family)